MARDPKYDILFEPVQIGPVTAPNRFFQVPHCNVLGHGRPRAEAENRRVKAEGGWGVVCTQEVEIHPSSDISPSFEGRIWDERDIPQHRLMTDAVHAHGALAGIELCYGGSHSPNHYSRIAPMSPSGSVVHGIHPIQARVMNKRDIADVRRWHVEAAKRAREAGYDIVYVYAGHDMSLLQHFFKTQYNQRSDEYGSSLENRVRLTKEILTDVKEAVGHDCAIAFRFATDELQGSDGLQWESEGRDIVGMLAELPDLWDVNISGWDNDSSTARFEPNEGYQEPYTAFVKTLTSKPVVGVGRFTSADAMVSQIKRGVLDLIGAARPSIADPFLPRKIDEGRIEDIRECIGCNICVAQDNLAVPIRCTQNPTQGEEWKQGWHPEEIEAAASYARVRDYREHQIRQKSNVAIYLDNYLNANDIVELQIPHLLIATGARWRRDGTGRQHAFPIKGVEGVPVLTPDDVLAGAEIAGKVLIYDDDHYYMGSSIAELCHDRGHDVCLVTPGSNVSSWTEYTLEQGKIQARLLALGVELIVSHQLLQVTGGKAKIANIYADQHHQQLDFETLVMVTSRQPDDVLYHALVEQEHRFKTLRAIGDCNAPGTVAAAVYDGHSAARHLESGQDIYAPLFAREMPALD